MDRSYLLTCNGPGLCTAEGHIDIDAGPVVRWAVCEEPPGKRVLLAMSGSPAEIDQTLNRLCQQGGVACREAVEVVEGDNRPGDGWAEFPFDGPSGRLWFRPTRQGG